MTANCIDSIAKIVREAGAAGLVLELTADNRVRLWGPKSKLVELKIKIQPLKDRMVAYLKELREFTDDNPDDAAKSSKKLKVARPELRL